PVFVDVDPFTLAIDLNSAESVIGPRTRGMFVIHPLGRAVDLPTYTKFCQSYGLTLIEDACESLGANWLGTHVGTVGLAGTFSFYFSHHISTVEGGMVVTESAALADDLRGFRVHGWLESAAPWLELVGGEVLDSVPAQGRRGRAHSWMTLPLRVRPGAPIKRAAVISHLEDSGVETRPIIAGNLARHPAISQVVH